MINYKLLSQLSTKEIKAVLLHHNYPDKPLEEVAQTTQASSMFVTNAIDKYNALLKSYVPEAKIIETAKPEPLSKMYLIDLSDCVGSKYLSQRFTITKPN